MDPTSHPFRRLPTHLQSLQAPRKTTSDSHHLTGRTSSMIHTRTWARSRRHELVQQVADDRLPNPAQPDPPPMKTRSPNSLQRRQLRGQRSLFRRPNPAPQHSQQTSGRDSSRARHGHTQPRPRLHRIPNPRRARHGRIRCKLKSQAHLRQSQYPYRHSQHLGHPTMPR